LRGSSDEGRHRQTRHEAETETETDKTEEAVEQLHGSRICWALRKLCLELKCAKSAKTAGGSADAQTSGSAPVVTQTSTDAASAGTSLPNSLSSSNGEYDSSAVLLVQLLSRLYLLHYF